MKRFALLLVALLAFAGMASAQMVTGGGLGVIIAPDIYTMENMGSEMETVDTFSAIGLNGFIASANGFGFFLDITAGYIISETVKVSIDGTEVSSGDADFTGVTTRTQFSILAGPSYAMDMGGMSVIIGAGVHMGMYLLADDYGGSLASITLGAGADANLLIPVGSFKLRVGCSLAVDFLPLVSDNIDMMEELFGLDVSYLGISIAPSIGVVF